MSDLLRQVHRFRPQYLHNILLREAPPLQVVYTLLVNLEEVHRVVILGSTYPAVDSLPDPKLHHVPPIFESQHGQLRVPLSSVPTLRDHLWCAPSNPRHSEQRKQQLLAIIIQPH